LVARQLPRQEAAGTEACTPRSCSRAALCTTKHEPHQTRKRATRDTHRGVEGGELVPQWVEAGEEDPDASTADGAAARRHRGEASNGAVVGMSMGLDRIGEATEGEAMPVDVGWGG
jgi:hypothetical protein